MTKPLSNFTSHATRALTPSRDSFRTLPHSGCLPAHAIRTRGAIMPRTAAGVMAAALLLPRIASAQETQTNSPSHYLLQAVKQLAAILEPRTNQPPRTFTTTVKVTKADGLPKEIEGREVAWHSRRRTTCGSAQTGSGKASSPAGTDRKYGSMRRRRSSACWALPDEAPDSTASATNNTAPLGPLKLPIPVDQLALLPFFADVKALPDETVGAAPCRVLKVTPKKEAIEAMKSAAGDGSTLAARERLSAGAPGLSRRQRRRCAN